jgi:uncharacterized membrane protein (TIGR02234 family)
VTDRRGLVVAVLGGLAAGGLALLGVSQPWARAEIAAAGVPRSTVEVAGTSAVPWVGALTLVVLAAALALVPTGGWARRAIGVIMLLAAAGVVLGSTTAGSAVDDALREDLAQSPASGGVDDATAADAADRPAWRWLTLGSGAAGIAVGVLAAGRGGRWPTMGSRYDAPRSRDRDPAPSEGETEEADLWRAMDEGRDPTA